MINANFILWQISFMIEFKQAQELHIYLKAAVFLNDSIFWQIQKDICFFFLFFSTSLFDYQAYAIAVL